MAESPEEREIVWSAFVETEDGPWGCAWGTRKSVLIEVRRHVENYYRAKGRKMPEHLAASLRDGRNDGDPTLGVKVEFETKRKAG